MHTTSDPLLTKLGLTNFAALLQLEGRMGFVTSRSGILLGADEVSSALWETGDYLILQDGQLSGASPALQRAFDQGLAAISPAQTLWVSSATGDFCLCKAVPASASVLWLVQKARADQPDASFGLEQAFALTRSEAALCRLLIKPGSEADIAKALGVSAETVRTHRKRIYMKLGVSERADLVRLAWRLSAML